LAQDSPLDPWIARNLEEPEPGAPAAAPALDPWVARNLEPAPEPTVAPPEAKPPSIPGYSWGTGEEFGYGLTLGSGPYADATVMAMRKSVPGATFAERFTNAVQSIEAQRKSYEAGAGLEAPIAKYAGATLPVTTALAMGGPAAASIGEAVLPESVTSLLGGWAPSGAMSGAAAGGMMHGMSDQGLGSDILGGAIGGTVLGGLGKALMPYVGPAARALYQRAQDFGLKSLTLPMMSAAQATKKAPLEMKVPGIASVWGGAPNEKVLGEFTQAAGREIGVPEEKLSVADIRGDAANPGRLDEIGARMNQLTTGKVTPDNDAAFRTGMDNLWGDAMKQYGLVRYSPGGPTTVARPQELQDFQDIMERTGWRPPGTGQVSNPRVTGDQYKALTEKSGPLMGMLRSGGSNLAEQFRGVLDDAMSRTMGTSDFNEFQGLRDQYRKGLLLARPGVIDENSGRVIPSKFVQAVRSVYKNDPHNAGNYGDLSDVADAFLTGRPGPLSRVKEHLGEIGVGGLLAERLGPANVMENLISHPHIAALLGGTSLGAGRALASPLAARAVASPFGGVLSAPNLLMPAAAGIGQGFTQ
jgi:hypothetical protein